MVDDIIAYENGEMDDDEVIEFFQRLKDTGTIRALQGSYHRTLAGLIQGGLVQ